MNNYLPNSPITVSTSTSGDAQPNLSHFNAIWEFLISTKRLKNTYRNKQNAHVSFRQLCLCLDGRPLSPQTMDSVAEQLHNRQLSVNYIRRLIRFALWLDLYYGRHELQGYVHNVQAKQYQIQTQKKDDERLTGFRVFLRRKGLKEVSILGILHVVGRTLDVTSLDEVEEYFLKLLDSGRTPQYINSIMGGLRYYGEFLNRDDIKKLKFFRIRHQNAKSTMSDQEIEDFLNLPAEEHVQGMYLWHYKKNTLFWKCLAFSGARTGEIAKLTIDQVDFGRGIFVVVDSKTGPRNVPISPALVSDLKEHIALLKGNLLFPAMRTGKPLERGAWNFDFHARLSRLGIKRPRLTPYSLRHSFITRNWDMGLPTLQKIVGHRQIETTAHYTHLVTKDIVNAIKKDSLVRSTLSGEDQVLLAREILEKSGFIVRNMQPRADGGFTLEVFVK